jgi:hypothetical protein
LDRTTPIRAIRIRQSTNACADSHLVRQIYVYAAEEKFDCVFAARYVLAMRCAPLVVPTRKRAASPNHRSTCKIATQGAVPSPSLNR